MSRLALPLVLLLAACSTGSNSSPTPNLQMPTFQLQQPPLVAPRDGEGSARFAACRAEATRVVQFRERGQTMRDDEIAGSVGSFGNSNAVSTLQAQRDRSAAEAEIDRLTRACMASPAASTAVGATGR
jgi:hypothetical protein